MSEKSFVAKVLAILKGGDEAKIGRFQKRALKFWENQIKIRKDEIEKLKEVLVDLAEKLDEAVFTIDLDQIKTTEATENYIQDYTSSLFTIMEEEKEVKSQIQEKNDEILSFIALMEELED